MAMLSALFTGISGMRNHQTMLDTISNNVANVNTTGFKAGRVQFGDLLSQTIVGATGSDAVNNRGGTNPVQSGSGVGLASIDTSFRQGTLQATGNATDLAITGDGFFIAQSGASRSYTRAGSFRFDSLGRLVDPSGGLIQGWSASVDPNDALGRLRVDASNPSDIGNITISSGMTLRPQETRHIEIDGNLDAGANAVNLANAPAGHPGTTTYSATDNLGTAYSYTIGMHEVSFDVYDSLGNAHPLVATFTHTGGVQIDGAPPGMMYDNNHWSWSIDVDPADTSVVIPPDNIEFVEPSTGTLIRTGHSGSMGFNTDGSLDYWNPDDWNNTLGGVFAQWGLTTDANAGAVIGLAGNFIPAGDVPSDAVSNPPPTFDNAPSAGSVLPAFPLFQIPITLVYQTISQNPATPVPPAGVTAGSLVNLLWNADMPATPGVTPTQAYVQTINVDFGHVEAITNYDNDWVVQGGPTPEGGIGFLGDGWMDLVSTPGRPGHIAPQFIGLGDGGRDGLTQDATGEFRDVNGTRLYFPKHTAFLRSQDGSPEGVLQSLSVSPDGKVLGAFSNNVTQELAQVAVATFMNPAGLERTGDAHFIASANSGSVMIGTALTGGRGSVIGGVIEQSNVDLSLELTDMIVAQRGFEVNARMIGTADRVLDSLVNLGRG